MEIYEVSGKMIVDFQRDGTEEIPFTVYVQAEDIVEALEKFVEEQGSPYEVSIKINNSLHFIS